VTLDEVPWKGNPLIDALGSALGMITPEALMYLGAGVLVAQIMAVIPGLGASVTLAMVVPFAYGTAPENAIFLLVAAAVTTGTGNSITSIVLGVPGSPSGVVTIFDGHPLAKKGESSRAIVVALTASFLGGLVGAIALMAAIPLVRPFVLAMGPGEFFALVLLAIVLMATISNEPVRKGLLAAGLGLMLSFVGADPTTGASRFTFGMVYLADGLSLVPVIIGVFAIAEMIDLIRTGGSISRVATRVQSRERTRAIFETLRHWRAVVHSSLVGTVIGFIPGLGGETAQFVAYSRVARVSKHPEEFGKGSIEGLIAADACVNAKEGSALATSLAFGIPGSGSLAILLAGFIAVGLQPGPEMLTSGLDYVWLVVISLVVANALASGVLILVGKYVALVTQIPAHYVVPAVFATSFIGAYLATRHIGDLFVLALAACLGYAMKSFGYPRVLFVVGFVLGPFLDRNLFLALQIHGPSFVTRPVTGLLLAATVLTLALHIYRLRTGGDEAEASEVPESRT
jgi:putative tricarboxylic transport membrane protein